MTNTFELPVFAAKIIISTIPPKAQSGLFLCLNAMNKPIIDCLPLCGWVLFIIVIAVQLTGCSTTMDAAGTAIETTKTVNDAKFSGSQELYCNGQSTGAVARALGNDKDMWELYWTICNRYRGGLSDVDVPPGPGDPDGL